MPKSKARGKQAEQQTKKGLKSVAVTGKQLEAQVHTTLPPLVKGPLRGHVRVSLEGGIVWEYSIGPPAPKLCVRLKWWGEKSPGTFFRVPVKMSTSHPGDSTTLAYFPICAGLTQLTAYFKDMGALVCDVGLGRLTDDSMVIGQATVPSLAKLTPTSSIKGLFPIVTSNDIHLGHLHVHINIELAKTPQLSTTGTNQPPKTAQRIKNVTDHQIPEFIIGPGAQREHRLNPTPSPKKDAKTVRIDSTTKTKAGEVLDAKSWQPKESRPTIVGSKETAESRPALTVGAQQMGVISELIERGQKLRDEMVHSIANVYGNKRRLKTEGEKERPSIGGDSLTLLSAELAQERRHQPEREGVSSVSHDLDLDGVYVEVSSSEGEMVDDDDVSLSGSDSGDALLSALLLSHHPLPHTQTHHHEEHGDESVSGHKDTQAVVPPTQQREESETKSHRTETLSSRIAELGNANQPSKAVSKSTTTSAKTGLKTLDENAAPLQSNRGGFKTDSMTTLSSHFSGRNLESTIVSSVGMERLTRLGRVTSARVSVDELEIDCTAVDDMLSRQKKKKSGSKSRVRVGPSQVIESTTSATYFVEYQFPALLHHHQHGRGTVKHSGQRHHHEVMRIASKKMKDGIVNFSHCSVFPVVFDKMVIQQWWTSILVFRVYCRPASKRMPFLVGKAVVPLRKWLTSSSFHCQCHLEVKTSSIADAINGVSSDDPVIGTLSISLKLLEGSSKKHLSKTSKSTRSHSHVGSHTRNEDSDHESVSCADNVEEMEGEADEVQGQPVHFKEASLKSKDIPENKPTALQLLLLVPEAIDVRVNYPNRSNAAEHSASGTPNCYFVCKLFCASPHPITPVQWASTNPQFGFKQVHYLYLTPSLLDKLCNNFTVIEVWHKTPGTNTEDELVGLVKLSLHQFFLAYSEEQSAELLHEAELPVIAVDSYCPIVNPFTGTSSGHLAVLLALGTANQVSHLQQQYASGSYTLQRPYQPSHTHSGKSAVQESAPERHSSELEIVEHHVRHVFDLMVEGVRGLSIFDNTVWGEADCFVQYHFPTPLPSSDEAVSSEISLSPYRTGATLCVPNPSFSHQTQHSLLLPHDVPLQRELIAACGGGAGMSGGIPFELWRRFYYPNIRDQLVARASLPLAKLCALVSMQKKKGPNIQSFPLQLKLVSDKHKSDVEGGLLDVTVEYRALSRSSDDDQPSLEQSYVTLSIGVLRATGLKDAAELVAKDHPVPLGLASEVGVNTYVTVSIPGILKDKRSTKTIARSFAPEFSHFFDISLPLSLPLSPSSNGDSKTRPVKKLFLAEGLAESAILVEVWHKMSRRNTVGSGSAPPSSTGAVFGRRLGPAFSDVLLGFAEIPLLHLLQKHTGVRGWYPMQAPSDYISPVSDAETPTQTPINRYTGGVELSVSFSNEADQQTVLSSALREGWKTPTKYGIDMHLFCPSEVPPMSSFGGRHFKFELKMDNLWLPVTSVVVSTASEPTHHYCFLRYRFFDKDATVSSPKAISYAREGRACYQLGHTARACIPVSPQLEWYLKEECLEVQVWATLFARKKSSTRPQAKDTLLGSSYIPLTTLLREGDSKARICGCYPLFKAGVDSLGNQVLRVTITREVLEQPPTDGEAFGSNSVEILDSESESENSTVEKSSTRTNESDGDERKKRDTGKETSSEDKKSFEDMFSARVMIHQALHLPSVRSSTSHKECVPCAYVTLHTHPTLDKITTAVADESHRPTWEHQCITHIPNLYLQPHSPGLEMQVWSRHGSISSGTEKEREEDDIFIGCVNIDLSPLSYGLSQICGWYNIVDFGGQPQGQLKVSIVPTQRISYPSPMLSYPVHLSSTFSSRILYDKPSGYSLSQHQSSVEKLPSQEQPASRTSSMLFQQLRENIKDLDAVHQSLLTKLRETEQSSSCEAARLPLPEHSSATLQEVAVQVSSKTALHVGDPEQTYHPPSLSLDHSQHSLQKRAPLQSHETADRDSISSPSPLHSENELSAVSTSRSESSTPEERFPQTKASSTWQEHEGDGRRNGDDNEDRHSPREESPSRSSNPDRTYSITDVSMCSKLDEEVQTPPHSIEGGHIDSTPQLSESEDEVHSSSQHSSLIHTSPTVSQPVTTREHSQSPPKSGGDENDSQSSSQVTVSSDHCSSSLPDHDQSHSPGSNPDKSPRPLPTSIPPCKSLDKHISDTKSTSLHRLPPPTVHLPDPNLPNFFMPPHELEQSMRRLRNTALSRPPPRTSTTTTESFEADRKEKAACSISSLQTLNEVKEFLESRRKTASSTGKRGGKKDEYFAAETKRIATIFSS